MKKIFTYVLSLTLLASTSFSFISCNDDDVETVMNIITALLTNGTADLDNTAWAQQDQDGTYVYAFKGNQKGKIYFYQNSQLTATADFTYAYDSSQNVLTLSDQKQSVSYTVQSFTAGSQMVLVDGNNTQYVFTSTQMPSGPLDNTIWYQRTQQEGQVYIILYNFQTNGKGIYEQYIVKDNNQELDGQLEFTFTYDENTKKLVLTYSDNTSETYTVTFDSEKLIMVDNEQLQYVFTRYNEN